MLFNSKIFILVFLPIALAGFFLLARTAGSRAARLWLLLASFVFYGWWSVPYLVRGGGGADGPRMAADFGTLVCQAIVD